MSSSTWEEYIVKDVCESVIDCVNKTAPIVDYETPYKMIRTTNVKMGRINLAGARYVEKEVFEKWTRRAVPKVGDVILTREAPLGDVGMITTPGEKIFLGQRLMQYRADPEKLDSNYLLYALQGSHMQGQLKAVGSGSTVEHVRVGDAENLKIKLPDLKKQKKLGQLLKNYDNLIENNNRRIVILEDIAQSLYREWFVKLRFPGYQNTKFKESSLGMIPEGWEIKKLFDVSSPTYGFAFKSRQFNENNEGTKIVRIRNIQASESATYTLELPKKAEQILKDGDLLIGMDGDFHMGKWSGGHAYLCQRVVKISPNDEVSPYFVFLSFKQPIINLNKSIVGTTVAHLGDKHLQEINIVVPEETIFKEFSSIVDPVFKEELNLEIRNKNLKKQRDFLLPKLISGHIAL